MIDPLDKAIIRLIQQDLPLVANPYGLIAEKLGISENLLLERLQHFKKTGVLRRLGAILHHRKTGYTANAMVVWSVPDDQVDWIGQQLAQYPQVTHCYHRESNSSEWPYKLFSMVHCTSVDECHALVASIAKNYNIDDYQLLFSSQELKKVSMAYFTETATE